jgi:putative ABC transport system permease protein
VVVLSLALGIALNTIMYGMLDALLHPRIDMVHPENLYWIRFYGDYGFHVDNRQRDEALATGLHNYEAITRYEPSIRSRFLERGQNLTEGPIANIAPNFFKLLGARPVAGRLFLPSDETSEARPVVIGARLLSALFPNGESPIGATILIDREPHTVIGVVSDATNFPNNYNVVWRLAPLNPRSMYIRLIRLRRGATPADADRELSVIANRIAAQSGEAARNVAFRFHQAADPNFQFKGFHLALIAAVVSVLLVVCANLANIQLARGIARQRELALRAALGASRRGLVVHLAHEATILAGAGLVLGLLFTFLGSRGLAALIPPSVGTYVVKPQLSWRVLAFALAVTSFCVLAIGVAPAIPISHADPNELLKSGAGTGATKRNRRRYGWLVGVEVALALALSSAAVAMVRMSAFLDGSSEGYDPRSLAVGYLGPTLPRGTVVRWSELLDWATTRAQAVSGVESATAWAKIGVENNAVSVDDAGTGVREFPAPGYGARMVSPTYFRTLRLPIIAGRDFFDGERDRSAVIVDEQTARVLWPNQNPVGSLVKLGDRKSDAPYVQVVGVVGEQDGFRSDQYKRGMPTVSTLGNIYYLPGPLDTVVVDQRPPITAFVARAWHSVDELAMVLRRELFALGGAQIQTMDAARGITRARQSAEFTAEIFVLFAALGIGLAAFGIYGVVAHSVAERRRELGVRIALGATSRDVIHAVLRESLVVALAGAAGGLAATKLSLPLIGSMIRSDDMFNAPLFAGIAVALVATAAATAFVPALRATRIDPAESLRCE